MKLPYRPADVHHKYGGKIVVVEDIIRKPDEWFFMGIVRWDDGSGDGKTQRIRPGILCSDSEGGQKEITELLRLSIS